MRVFLAFLTYFSYFFIVFLYTLKIRDYMRLPFHLRWELYPVIPEERYRYGGSYMEEKEFWKKRPSKSLMRGFFYLLKDYFLLSEYFKLKRLYWLFLYPWHIGFISIILFHVFCFFSGLFMNFGISVRPSSHSFLGAILFYLTGILGPLSFFSGLFGSIGLFLLRLKDRDLRIYAVPMNFANYLFTFFVFLSGLFVFILDPGFSGYRAFWMGLINLKFQTVSKIEAIHIILFSLFLIYLPFTRSIHYITRLFGFFLIRWDDRPNIKGEEIERKIEEVLQKKVSWSAPHILKGKTWKENALEVR